MMNKKSTKKALLMSALSLLLCCSMLVGTTFAWFTDEVTSGANKIYAGNLDVEVVYDDNGTEKDVQDTDKLFDGILWEPGAVAFENITVKNVGTLALSYTLSINFENENYVVLKDGTVTEHSLANALKVAMIPGKIEVEDREELLELVETKKVEWTELSSILEVGKLYPSNNKPADGLVEESYGIVIWWEPGENDNNWNVHNGKTTTDEQPLHIDLGIKLTATQLPHEEDSFNKYYDGLAFVPPASVIPMGEKTVPVYQRGDLALDASFQFQPQESLEQAQASAQRYYHADFVVYADKDVPADSIMLAGYYQAWCDNTAINNNWIGMSTDQTIAAGTQIRLVEVLGATVNYEEICRYGNDGVGFLCGLADISGNNALNGTTVTVELRVYETTGDPTTTTGPKNEETGNYTIVGTYTHTFVEKVSDSNALKDALDAGLTDIKLGAGTYTFPSSSMGADTTLYCDEDTVFEGTSSLDVKGATVIGATFSNETGKVVGGSINGTFKDCDFTGSNALRYCYAGETVVFENCTFSGDVYGVHFDGGENDAIFRNCTFSGFNATGSALTKLTLENCTFVANDSSAYNGINLWGDSELINCTFVFDGSADYEWVDACGDNKTYTFTNCVVTDGTTERALAASDVGDYGTGNTITVN